MSRLRHRLKDQLFVRTPAGMTPTPRAEQLARPARRALDELQLALEPDVFSPATAERIFVVALNNFGAIALDAPVDRFAAQTLVVDHYVVAKWDRRRFRRL